MRLRFACLLCSLASLAGCSALVAPDSSRLQGDAGLVGTFDAATPPGVDGGATCGAGLIACGTACVSAATDTQHCGSCTNACAAGQSCISGTCTGGSGVVLGNPNDCGASHARCASLQLCVSGACVCRSPYTDVGGTCIDLSTDPSNCGSPGHVCAGRCAAGVCVPGDCPRGTSSCNGACVDLRRDPGNCGDCGNACTGTQICAGQCRDLVVPTGCTSCPCDACRGGAQCCAYPGLSTPVCIDNVDACPAA